MSPSRSSTRPATRRAARASEAAALKPKWFQILLALADRDRHGLEIVREVERSTEGTLRLWPGALYGALEELAANEWIREVETPPNAARDGNPRYFRVTETGREVLRAEVERFDRMLSEARAKIAADRSQ